MSRRYVIVYADGLVSEPRSWEQTLFFLRICGLTGTRHPMRPVRVELAPAPRV